MAKKKIEKKTAAPRSENSGAAKLKASGRKPIMLAVTPEEYATLSSAAAEERRPLAQFVAYYAIRRAEEMQPAQQPAT